MCLHTFVKREPDHTLGWGTVGWKGCWDLSGTGRRGAIVCQSEAPHLQTHMPCPFLKTESNLLLKGVIRCEMHFYMLFEHKCVLAVCVHNHPIMIKIHPVFFFYLLKSLPLSQIKPFSASCLCDVTQTQALPR